MERFWRKLGFALGRHWKIVVLVLVAVTVLLGIGATHEGLPSIHGCNSPVGFPRGGDGTPVLPVVAPPRKG